MKFKASSLKPLILLLSDLGTAVLPVRTAYKLSQLAREASEAMKFYESEGRKLFDAFAQKDENGNLITENGFVLLKPETKEEGAQKLHDLEDLEVDLPDITFSFDELDTLSLTLDQFSTLFPFIKN